MSEPTESISPVADTWENANEGAAKVEENVEKLTGALFKVIFQYIKRIFSPLPKYFFGFFQNLVQKLWIFILGLPSPQFLLSSIPQSINSLLITPFHFISSIPGAVRSLFDLTLGQTLVSFSSTAFIWGLLLTYTASRGTNFGHGLDSFRNFLFWAPIYTTIVLVLSNLEPLRELLVTLYAFFVSSPWSAAFVFLFVFKFLKIFVHLYSYIFLTSYATPFLYPSVSPQDVTVIIPSIGDFGDDFIDTVRTVLANNPAKVLVSTVGSAKYIRARRVVAGIIRTEGVSGDKIQVISCHKPSKRAQCVQASLEVKTDLIAYTDDHVIWPPTFLQSVLSEFEDEHVGFVGTCKRVIRDPGDNWSDSVRNFLACIYLERHNYEMTATYNLDGGVWVISGRTQLIRTDIVHSLKYRQAFLSETFLGAGPINCDDDNFTTRWVVNNGWKLVFHNRPEALVYTTLGTTGGWDKFYQQLLRWARAIWRSHPKTIFDGKCWRVYPWTSYAMFISNLVNISIIYDPLLFLALFKSEFYTEDNHAGAYLFWALILSRLVKPWSYFMRHKNEIIWALPVELLFGYIHGVIRLIALFTCRDIGWGGRDLRALER